MNAPFERGDDAPRSAELARALTLAAERLDQAPVRPEDPDADALRVDGVDAPLGVRVDRVQEPEPMVLAGRVVPDDQLLDEIHGGDLAAGTLHGSFGVAYDPDPVLHRDLSLLGRQGRLR